MSCVGYLEVCHHLVAGLGLRLAFLTLFIKMTLVENKFENRQKIFSRRHQLRIYDGNQTAKGKAIKKVVTHHVL